VVGVGDGELVGVTANAGRGGSTLPNTMLARLGPPLLVLLAVGVSLRPGLENDAWWHLASGRWMLDHGEWLRVDVFSWVVQGEPWVRPGLIADVVMASLYGLGGAPLLVLAASACFMAAFAVLVGITRASPAATLAAGALCILTAIVAAVPRPLIVSLLLTAVTVAVLEPERRTGGTRWLWSLPVVAVTWVNIHGAFVVLFVLVGCHGLAVLVDGVRSGASAWRRSLGRLVAVGAAALLATLVNPFGPRLLPYALETLELGVLREFVHEWRQPVLADLQFWPLFLLVGVSAVALGVAGERRRTVDVVLLVVFGGLALTAARHAAIFAVVAFPTVARLLSRAEPIPWRAAWGRARPTERRLEAGLLVVVVALVAVVTAPALTSGGNERATAELLGEAALDRAAAGDLPGRLWNSYDLGGYVIWHSEGEVLVSMDSRTDLYGDGLVREHIAEWAGARDAPARFAEQGIRTALVERVAPLASQLEEAGWLREAEDHRAVLLRSP
jgi:hypothetical protein